MKLNLKFACIALLAGVTFSSNAESLDKLIKMNQTTYIVQNSVSREGPGVFGYWEVVNTRDGRSLKVYNLVKCSPSRTKVLMATMFSQPLAEGRIVENVNVRETNFADWVPIPKGSYMDDLRRVVCNDLKP